MPFQAGAYRPVALWENGSAAYSVEGVQLARAGKFNWVYLIGYRGLPPEVETIASLREAVQLYHKAGVRVCATLHVSSCAYTGSYRERSWYALDPSGHRIPAGAGRAFVCWNAPEWLTEIQDQIRVLIEGGVDGIFFREPWIGGIPHEVKNGLLGFAGCHDARCRSAYAVAAGIPKQVNTDDERIRHYLEWRANLTLNRLQEWIAFGRELKPDIHIAIEGINPLRRNAWVQYGSDVQRLGELADRVAIAGSPAHLEPDGNLSQNITALAAASNMGVIICPEPNERILAVSIAEAQTVQGIVIPCDSAGSAARMNQWIEANGDWLGQGENCSPLGIYAPPMKYHWARSAPYIWAACQMILQNGLPFRLVRNEDWSTLKTLIIPPGDWEDLDHRLAEWIEQGGQVIALHQKRPGHVIWTDFRPPRASWVHWEALRWITYPIGEALHRRASQPARQAEIPQWKPPQEDLLSTLGMEFAPRVEIEGQGKGQCPILFVMRREIGGDEQWHFVNYSDESQRVTVHAPEFVSGWVHSPQEAWRTRIFGHSMIMTVDDYKVVRLVK